MKIKILALSILLIGAGSTTAFASRGKVVTDSLYSNILNSMVKYNVYLPAGFDQSQEEYPVIYLLHGLEGSYDNWVRIAGMQYIADELMESGECVKSVIIMPNAGDKDTRHIQSGYFNVEGWNYEDFFFNELIPGVESKYRCIGDKAHRAVMGLSMGGGGSTVYCQKHPEAFSSCYAMSPWLYEELPADMPKDKLYLTVVSVRENAPIPFVEKADEQTIEKLRTVAWFFDCGDDDDLVYLSVDIHRIYNEKGIRNELRVHNGSHNFEYWHRALRDALPFASRNFGR